MTDTKDSISHTVEEIWKSLGYVHDGSYNISPQPGMAQKLGEVWFDYLVASTYDTEWEGFEEAELDVIRRLLDDFRLFVENG